MGGMLYRYFDYYLSYLTLFTVKRKARLALNTLYFLVYSLLHLLT
jgi:hypothetical protein